MLGTTNGDRSYDKGDDLATSSDVQTVVSLYGISSLSNISAGFAPGAKKVHESLSVIEALLVHAPAFGDFLGASFCDPVKALAASPMGQTS